MTKASIESKVLTIVANQLSLRENDFSLKSKFVDDLGADSLDIVELIMEVEEAYDIEIPDEDVEHMASIKDIVDYIVKAVA
ncbi:MAG: acyl carrier protein [bacterium]